MPNFPLNTLPGIKRDGTIFEGNYYTDGQHCRFQRGRPRSMGGYREITNQLPEISRGMYVQPRSNLVDMYSGSASHLVFSETDFNGMGGAIVDRTPSTFTASPNNLWQFDSMFDTASSANVIIAHAAQNLNDIDNSTVAPIWYGPTNASTALIPFATPQSADGGILVIHPFLFYFGSDGLVAWSDANTPAIFTGGLSGSAFVTSNKIVSGLQTRGGSGSPSGLLWSLDALVKATFTGGATAFQFDTITDQSSILSSQGVIEYDGIYYWAAVDRFVFYNGVVRELPNQMNVNFFFENLNFNQRQKVWATKMPYFGEIWWHFPYGNSTECNHVVIYNVREQSWYDTAMSRSAGYFPQLFRYPVMADNEVQTGNTYQLWQHEFGQDKVEGLNSTAIDKNITTSDITFCATGPDGKWIGVNRNLRLTSLEPDSQASNSSVQTGQMTVTVSGRKFANSPLATVMPPYPFDDTTEKIDMREQYRQMYLKFDSNTLGGSFELGQMLITVEPGDVRP